MATVLLTAEFGGGGAARALLTVARALAGRGHQPVLAPRDVTEPAPLLAREPWPVRLRAAVLDQLRAAGLAVPPQPADRAALLRGAAVVLHQGGCGTAHAALAAGRPQVLLPEAPEQTLTARLVQDLGAGVVPPGPYGPEAVARAVLQVLGERRFADRAAACARAIQARPRRDPLPATLEACRRYLGD